jgi:hypothetical protein
MVDAVDKDGRVCPSGLLGVGAGAGVQTDQDSVRIRMSR